MFFELISLILCIGCIFDLDCENDGDFCYNLIRLCLLMFINLMLIFFWKIFFLCNFYVDCKMIEFCYFFIGMWN